MTIVTLLVVSSILGLSAGSEYVNFDFAWRFSDSSGSTVHCQDSDFPHNLSAVQCRGLHSNGAKNADDCRDACCGDGECLVWQYADSQGCWMGQSNDCNHKASIWVGGGRDSAIVPLPGQAKVDYDDSSWEMVDVPHDGIINGTYDQNGVESHAYLPIKSLWYRKHFNIPDDWKGQSIWVEFQGVFRASRIYFNGQFLLYHDSGYTTFNIRLDNATTVNFGDSGNVIAVVANADSSYSGWWYEGGGIYRHTRLFTTSHIHFVPNSVYGVSEVVGNISDHSPTNTSMGQYADAEFYPLAEITNENSGTTQVRVNYQLYDKSGKKMADVSSDTTAAETGKYATVNMSIPKISSIELWSINRPYLYTLVAQLIDASSNNVLDNVTISIGVRQTRWDPKSGFFLNEKHFIWRGFNNHNDFTGVGVALPDRLHLFRAQMMRAVGANAWRMSHNPPTPYLLDVLDSVGVVVWDENRQFGENDIWMMDQRDMVKRDRNHPSIMTWSFCNEGGCSSGDKGDAAEQFAKVSKDADPFRPIAANMNGDIGNSLTKVVEVQGFSHRNGEVYDSFHKQLPDKPLIGSECCSCRTQRGEDFADSKKPVFGSFNADCNQAQTGYELNRDFVAGCMVWTLFDYYGEPTPYGWPMVSSSFGSIDLAGFAKASAYWYRAWWYYRAKSNTTYKGFDVPFNPPSLVDPYASSSEENTEDGYMIHIVQNWEPADGQTSRTIQAYTNAEMAELWLNGKSLGKVSVNWQGWAEWSGITFSAGNITANALDSQNQVKAGHTVLTAGAAVKIVAMIDVPSTKTGTGSMLMMDGQDAGMVSAAIVDANGKVVPSSSANVTFRVLSGPGRIIGVGNGDPSCHEPNQVPWRSAYHGLVRAIVQVTENHPTSELLLKRLMEVDRDGGKRTLVAPEDSAAPSSIVVEASSEGLGSSTVEISVSGSLNNNKPVDISSLK